MNDAPTRSRHTTRNCSALLRQSHPRVMSVQHPVSGHDAIFGVAGACAWLLAAQTISSVLPIISTPGRGTWWTGSAAALPVAEAIAGVIVEAAAAAVTLAATRRGHPRLGGMCGLLIHLSAADSGLHVAGPIGVVPAAVFALAYLQRVRLIWPLCIGHVLAVSLRYLSSLTGHPLLAGIALAMIATIIIGSMGWCAVRAARGYSPLPLTSTSTRPLPHRLLVVMATAVTLLAAHDPDVPIRHLRCAPSPAGVSSLPRSYSLRRGHSGAARVNG